MGHQIILQILQVLTVLFLSPLLEGIIIQFEARVRRYQGPGVFQPYRDLWKLFHKELVLPHTASWFFIVAPILAFSAILIVPLLIPVLTNFPLPLSDMGDILGGGLLLALGGFVISLAALDSGSIYGSIGSSRTVLVTILAEPVLILVFIGIAILSKSMLPFVINHLLVNQLSLYFNPAHLFLVAAFFVILLVETGRMPIHSGSHIEIYMIEESRILEYSGPLLAILKWGGMMKQFIIYTLFCNLLFFPWGLSSTESVYRVPLTLLILFGKYLIVGCGVVLVNTMQARLRFFRYQEPLAFAFAFAFIGVLLGMMQGGSPDAALL